MDNRVRELRAAHDLSQGQLGDALGVSRQTINAIENGRYLPSLPLAIAIARYFGSTVEQILYFGDRCRITIVYEYMRVLMIDQSPSPAGLEV